MMSIRHEWYVAYGQESRVKQGIEAQGFHSHCFLRIDHGSAGRQCPGLADIETANQSSSKGFGISGM
jgi:hypothetical protein